MKHQPEKRQRGRSDLAMETIPATPRPAHHNLVAWLAVSLLVLSLLAVAGRARADCQYNFNQSGTVTFTPPATIYMPNSTPVGTILWTSPPVTPANQPTLTCSGTTNSGIQNTIAGQPTGGDDTLFPTNVTGLSYRLLHPDISNPLHAYPNESVSTGTTFGVASELQLVVTGPIAVGSILSAGQLGQWNVEMCKKINPKNGHCSRYLGPHPAEIFSTSSSIAFAAPACTVAVDPTVVTLPTVFSSNFGGTGSTAGQTPFNVQLTCQAGANLHITLNTSAPAPGLGGSGVIAPTSGAGYAQGVGVQIVDQSGNPVSFGTAISAGQATGGAFNIPFFARYYQTGASASGGKVSATATYTLTYQ